MRPISSRRVRRRKPGPARIPTIARCSRSGTSTSCIVVTPDHWHALPMIEAVKSGMDVWVQKPISVDVVEGQAMLAAARKYKKVVQVGMQRRSTPHLVRAATDIVKAGKLGTIGLRRGVLLLPHARDAESSRHGSRRPTSTTRCGPVPRRCGPTTRWCTRGSWRAFMEYSNGIMGDMCVHMLDMVRWMLDLGMPNRITSAAASSSTRRARRTSPTRRRRRSSSAICLSSGRIAAMARRRTRSIRGARRSTATRARSRPAR